MKFILALLFFIIIFRLASSMAFRYLSNKARKDAHQQPDGTPPSSGKKKKIAKDKGDYVDFEELE